MRRCPCATADEVFTAVDGMTRGNVGNCIVEVRKVKSQAVSYLHLPPHLTHFVSLQIRRGIVKAGGFLAGMFSFE